MTDEEIVRRLRAPAYWMSGSGEGHEGENDTPREAADVIDRLTAELARKDAAIEEALDKLDKLARLGNEPYYGNSVGNEIARAAYNTIRAALGEREKENGAAGET